MKKKRNLKDIDLRELFWSNPLTVSRLAFSVLSIGLFAFSIFGAG